MKWLFISSFLSSIVVFSLSGCSYLIGALRPHQEDAEETEVDGYAADSDLETTKTLFHSREDREIPSRASKEEGRSPASVMTQTSALDSQSPVQYKNGFRASRADFVDDAPNEGSLWASDGQTNYYFTKNKVKSVGDLVSVQLEADLAKEIHEELRRTLPVKEKEREVSILMEKWEALRDTINTAREAAEAKAAALAEEQARRLEAEAMQLASAKPTAKKTERSPTSAVSPVAAPSPGQIPPEPTFSDVDLTKSLEIKAGDTMLVEIVERFPNGNYKVRGIKRVNYKNGAPKHVGLTAIVRSADLGGEEETLTSGKLYEHRVETIRN